jgi:ABC-2 type transport system permease protein
MTNLILRAEWRRFIRQRTHLWVLATLGALLCMSAAWSGLSARALREANAQEMAVWKQARAGAREAAAAMEAATPRDDTKAMMAAFQFARLGAPPAHLSALGGLALGTGTFDLLSPTMRVTVESRHTDARRSDRITNPFLEDLGPPDFATLVALLLPLAVLGLCYGLVQEDREQGRWRLVIAQCAEPWRMFAIALCIRAAMAWAVAAGASLLGFALDPGSTWHAVVVWLATLAAFAAFWTALAGLFCLLPVSSGAAALGMLGAWLLATFVVPAALAGMADSEAPMPSRLMAIAELRAAQQEAEVHMEDHLAAWYAAHPADRPALRASHTWPVSFLPRYLAQDLEVRPLMAAFDETRARRFVLLERWSWLSPGLVLAMTADRLAGIDAPRYARHVNAVNSYEDAWRAYFVPRIMSYRGLTAEHYDKLPIFQPLASRADSTGWRGAMALSILTIALTAAVALARAGLQRH